MQTKEASRKKSYESLMIFISWEQIIFKRPPRVSPYHSQQMSIRHCMVGTVNDQSPLRVCISERYLASSIPLVVSEAFPPISCYRPRSVAFRKPPKLSQIICELVVSVSLLNREAPTLSTDQAHTRQPGITFPANPLHATFIFINKFFTVTYSNGQDFPQQSVTG